MEVPLVMYYEKSYIFYGIEKLGVLIKRLLPDCRYCHAFRIFEGQLWTKENSEIRELHYFVKMYRNRKEDKKGVKNNCIICAMEPISSLLLPFLPLVKVQIPNLSHCRIELGSIYHRGLSIGILFVMCLIFARNTYYLPEFCSKNEQIRCLTEVSDDLYYFIGIPILYPLSKRYSNDLKLIRHMVDIFESTKSQSKNCTRKTRLVEKAYLIARSIRYGLYIFYALNCAFCYVTMRHSSNQSPMTIVHKYLSTVTQITVCIFYFYTSLLTKYIMHEVNESFFWELEQFIPKTPTGHANFVIVIREYIRQLSSHRQIWMNINESIKKVVFVSLSSFACMAIIYNYCLITGIRHNYFDIDWFYRTTSLIIFVVLVLESLDQERSVSCIDASHYYTQAIARVKRANIVFKFGNECSPSIGHIHSEILFHLVNQSFYISQDTLL